MGTMTTAAFGSPERSRFELLGRVGAGHHGVVFRAHDHQLGRDVAIKRFAHVLTDDPRAMHRIRREATALSRVSHPNVVTVHDIVNLPDGDGEVTPHLVMEFVDGISVREFIARHGPSERSVGLIGRVLAGLDACHRAGILHLDIKPANVLITHDSEVKLVDFGISRAASDLTATIAGTPHYMAPEQYEGRVDERSDIYSVGCLMFETLTGQPPFPGTAAEQWVAHRHGPRPDPRTIDPTIAPELAAIVMRAMAVAPDDRFATVREFAAAIESPHTMPAPARAAHRVVAHPETREAATAPAVTALPPARSVPPAAAPSELTVGRARRTATTAWGLAVGAFVFMLVPAIALASIESAPASTYRPGFLTEPVLWWFVAMALAAAHLTVARPLAIGQLRGPRRGHLIEPWFGPTMRRGLASVLGSAVRGAVPLLFPWYVAAVVGFADGAGAALPADIYGSWVTIAWLCMPLVAALLTVRAFTAWRWRIGSIFMSVMRLGGAALAVVLFLAYLDYL